MSLNITGEFNKGCRLLLLILLGIFSLPKSDAQIQHSSPLTKYVQKVYTNNDGLPQNRCRVLIQTRDGFLWIGTQDGLARFNGAIFQVFTKNNTPALNHSDITCLYEANDGSLWIGTFNGLTQWRKGEFISHPIQTGPIRGLSQDSSGNLWIATMNKGIYVYKNEIFDSITTVQGLASNSLNTFTIDRQGNAWAALSGMGISMLSKGRWQSFHTNNGLPNNSVRSFCAASDSSVWIGTENGLVKWKNNSFKIYTTADGLSDNIIPSLAEDRSGSIWIGTERGGICRLKDNIITAYNSLDGLSSNYVSSILEDREGSIWVGTFDAGLNQFWKGKFLNLTPNDGLPNEVVTTVIQSRTGSQWIGTSSGKLLSYNGKKFTTFSTKDGLPTYSIRALFEDSHSNLWIGTYNGLILYQNGTFRVFSGDDGLYGKIIRAIAEDQSGHLWIGTLNGGIYRQEDGKFISIRDKGIPLDVIRSVFVDKSDAVWIGGNEAIMCLRGGIVTTYTQSDGLPFEPIYTIIQDHERTLWMGSYGGGLVCYKNGKFVRVMQVDGLFNNVIYQILEDTLGNLWMSSLNGVGRVSKKSINDFIDGKIKHIQCKKYSISDGMVSTDCTGNTQSGGCKTSDGYIWFPTSSGIVIINPNNLNENPLPPPMMIERALLNGQDYSPYTYGQAPPGSGQVEISYGGMSFIAPQRVYFKYMLEGFDTEWRFVDTRRIAYYTNLAPGEYNFRVSACNSDGVWNETGASYAFELRPHIYETKWFYGIVLIVVIGGVGGIYWLRMLQLVRHKQELETRVLERTAQLEAANKELEAFSYSVSHDLRAPLRSIDGFSSALLEDYEKVLDDQGKNFLQRVRTASQRMDNLIDGMLKLSRVTRGELKKSPVDLSALAGIVAKELQSTQPDRNVEFYINADLTVQADKDLMLILLENLLGNAWKFTSKHKSAKIEIGAIQNDNQQIYFVRDDGVGFDKTYANKLFGAFQRMHSEAEFKGTGIGLATVRRIVNRHGGSIWANSEVDKGAVFYFTLGGRQI